MVETESIRLVTAHHRAWNDASRFLSWNSEQLDELTVPLLHPREYPGAATSAPAAYSARRTGVHATGRAYAAELGQPEVSYR
jgi:hypothetical protein